MKVQKQDDDTYILTMDGSDAGMIMLLINEAVNGSEAFSDGVWDMVADNPQPRLLQIAESIFEALPEPEEG